MLTISSQRVDLLPGEAAAFTYIGLAQAGTGNPPWNMRLRPRADGTSSLDASYIESPELLSNAVQVTGAASVTVGPSPTWSTSPTFGPSPTRSASPTPTSTRTPIHSATATPSASPTFSPSPSVTPDAPFCGADVYAPTPYQAFYGVKPFPGGGAVFSGHQTQGSVNILLRRYDATGQALWTQDQDGGAGAYELGTALGVDAAGRSYVSAWTPDNGVLRSYDSAGQLRWSRSGPGSGYADALAVMPDGRVAVAFTLSGELPVVQAYDSDGNLLWQRQHTASNCFAFNVAFDQCGRLWMPLTCGTLAAYEADGTPAPTLALPGQGRDIAVDRQNRLIVAVWNGSATVVQAMHSDGSVAWSRSLAGTQPWGVAVDSEGSVYVSGDNGSGTPMSAALRPFVAKYNAQGDPLWTWWGPSGRAESVAVTDDGMIWVAAWTHQGQALALRLCQPAPSAPQALAGCASPTPTKTRTVTLTASPTRTVTPTHSPSASPSISSTPTPGESSQTVTPSPSITPEVSSPTFTPATVGPDPRVLSMVAFPHPRPRWIKVKLSQAAVEARFKLYSVSHVLVASWTETSLSQEWNAVRWPTDLGRHSSGHYRLLAQVRGSSGVWSEPKAITIHTFR